MSLDDPRRAVAALRIGVWDAVSDLILPRLVPHRRAGPLHRPVPRRPAGHAADTLAWDVGIDVPGGIARPDPELVARWGRGADEVWRHALANLQCRFQPTLVSPLDPPAGGVRLQVLIGGPWTTGWLVVPGVAERHTVAVVVGAGVVVLASPVPRAGRAAGWPGARLADLEATAVAVARRLAEAEQTSPIDRKVLIGTSRPFPDQWILK